MDAMTARQQGFTLIELAVAIVIIGALLGSLLMPLAAQKDAQAFEATRKSLQQIKQALIGYALINDRLPCPDTNDDGYEDACANPAPYEGKLPWKELGVDAKDAWGEPFYYTVDQNFVSAIPTNLTTSNTLTVRRDSQDLTIDSDGKSVAVAIILSSGKDRQLAPENDNKNEFYQADDFTPGGFDDVLMWISTYVLAHHLATVEKWP
jgi:prepilin-type N-terminal cleavage/methylation domain-containing protein